LRPVGDYRLRSGLLRSRLLVDVGPIALRPIADYRLRNGLLRSRLLVDVGRNVVAARAFFLRNGRRRRRLVLKALQQDREETGRTAAPSGALGSGPVSNARVRFAPEAGEI